MKKIKKILTLFMLLLALTAVFFVLKEKRQSVKNTISLRHLSSQNIILKDLTTGEILAEKNSEKKIAPASLTKIMTTLVVLEHVSDLTQTANINEENLNQLAMEGMALSGYSANDSVTIRDLLYGLMLPSGGDAAVTLATFVAGSEENFVTIMNDKAGQLGLNETHFTNTIGYDDPQHYSSAKDLSTLLESALANTQFKEIFTTQYYQSAPTYFHPEGVYLQSTLLNADVDLNLTNGIILGGKTGYTEKAGSCLASIAEVNGNLLLLINCQADGDLYTEQQNVAEAKEIYERAGSR